MVVDNYIVPDWPSAARVKSVITTRRGGVSKGAYAEFNVATHVGDDPQAVAENRRRLRDTHALPREPLWLQQVHGTRVIDVSDPGDDLHADGSYATRTGGVCAVMTADCLPVLLANTEGTQVAALHAGWRGLAAGIIEQGIRALASPGEQLLAYLGPAIGPEAFEVGADVRQAFCHHDPAAEAAFQATGEDKWLADIYTLARQRLRACAVTRIYGGDRCTYREQDEFFSYRRDGECGRMVSMIWIDDNEPL